jgi:O-antigen ligase
MTFSRGGLYCAAGGALAIMIVLFKDQRARMQIVPILALGFAVVNFFLLPYLQAVTEGALLTRFQDTDLTGRDELVRADLEIWKDNPVMGVGPGLARSSRGTYLYQHAVGPVAQAFRQRQVGAHTELSRMLAEHGVFGLASIVCLVLALYHAHKRGGNPRSRAWILGLTVWSFLFLLSNGMRTVAPSFALALGFAQLRANEDD